MRADVYWNLHRKQYSVRVNGKVVQHANEVFLLNPAFVVQPAGRERVLRERKKNVHAFVRGDVLLADFGPEPHPEGWQRVSYNPFKAPTFVDGDGAPVYTAPMATCTIEDGKPVVRKGSI